MEQKLSDVDRTLKDTTSMFNNRLDGQSIMLKNEHRNIVSLTHIMCRNKIALEKEMLNSQIKAEGKILCFNLYAHFKNVLDIGYRQTIG